LHLAPGNDLLVDSRADLPDALPLGERGLRDSQAKNHPETYAGFMDVQIICLQVPNSDLAPRLTNQGSGKNSGVSS